MADENRLGMFLRARRELVRPEDVGLQSSGRRRVPGLRREEIAMLAGVSAVYYIRLEQGRDRHPSPQVLDALAQVLQLDGPATDHLYELARPAPTRRRSRRLSERVRPALERLIDRQLDGPAFILGRRLDVLAANELARALHVSFTPGRNLVRDVFLDPEAQAGFLDLEEVQANTVGSLRAVTGADINDPVLTELVGELSIKSPEFLRLWARHEVLPKIRGAKRFRHPLVGELSLGYESFSSVGADSQLLVIYSAAEGSDSERALRFIEQPGRRRRGHARDADRVA